MTSPPSPPSPPRAAGSSPAIPPPPREHGTPGADRRKTWALALGLLLVAAALRVPTLGSKGFWGDEVWEAKLRVLPPGELLRVLPTFTEHPPLLFLLHSIGNAPGRPFWTYRVPDVTWGLAGVVLLYLLARKRFGEGPAAFAALLLAISPFHLRHSQDCTGYAAQPVLTMLTFAAFARAHELRRRKDFVLYGASLTLFLLSHYFALAAIAAQVSLAGLLALIHAVRRRRGRVPEDPRGAFLPRQLLTVVLACLPLLLWVPWMREQPRSFSEASGLGVLWTWGSRWFATRPAAIGTWFQALLGMRPPPPRTTPLLEDAIIAAGVLLSLARGPARLRSLAVAWAALHVAVRSMFWIHGLHEVERYLLFLYPFSLLLAGVALEALRRVLAGGLARLLAIRAAPPPWLLAAAPAAILAAGLVWMDTARLRFILDHEKAPWPQLTAYLEEHRRPQDYILAGAGWGLPEFLAFYLEDDWHMDARFPNPDYRSDAPATRIATPRQLLETLLDDPAAPPLDEVRIWTVTTPGPFFVHLPTARLREATGGTLVSFRGYERFLDLALWPRATRDRKSLVRFVLLFLKQQALHGVWGRSYHKPMFYDFPLEDLETVFVERTAPGDDLSPLVLGRYMELGWKEQARALLERRRAYRQAHGLDPGLAPGARSRPGEPPGASRAAPALTPPGNAGGGASHGASGGRRSRIR